MPTTFDTAQPLTDAFGTWYAEQWPAAQRHAARLIGDTSTAEDIASDVLVKVWQRWQVAGQPDVPQAYIRRSIHNAVATTIRRRQRDRAVLHRVEHEHVQDDPASFLADRDEVAQLLARLPESERTTMTMVYLDDLPAAEVARQLGIEPASVRSRLLRGRRRLLATA
jgi:RNA polymerase sigma factor (sigma-70 family)